MVVVGSYVIHYELLFEIETINDATNEESEGNSENGIRDEEREKLIQQLMQLLSSGDSEECSICLEILQDPVITR